MSNNIKYILLAAGLFGSAHAAEPILHDGLEEGSEDATASSTNEKSANTLNWIGSSGWGTSMSRFTSNLEVT